MRILVVSAGRSGSTASLAERVGDGLRACGSEVTVAEVRAHPPAADQDAVVVGASMRAGRWNPDMTRWIHRNASVLLTKPVAAFSVGMAAMMPWRDPGPHRTVAETFTQHGITPVAVAGFLGWWYPNRVTEAEPRPDLGGGPEPPRG